MIFLRLTFFSLYPKAQKKVRKSLQKVGFKMRLALLKMIGMKTSIVAGNS